MGSAVILPTKPHYGEACNRCGLCCALEVCEAGAMAFPGAPAPCPALKLTPDRKGTYCEIVAMEEAAGMERLIANALGIGDGCGMEDEVKAA